MANQVVVTQSGNVQVSIQPTPNVQVQVSRAAIGNVTVSNVSVANTANYAHQVLDANQPNITSLGTITGLTSSGNITAPFFLGNVIGNISGNIVVPGTNTSVLFNDAGVAGASDAFQFNKSSNTVTVTGNLSATNISGNGSGLSSITGSNVTGEVSYAAVANSVSGSNVSGPVAYATTANSVAGGNVSGQVAYAAVANSVAGSNVSGAVNLATYATTANSVAGANVSGTVANATHATIADSANSVAGSNVSGAVAYATTANAVAGSNVSGQVSYAATANSVALANVVGAGNIASINIDGNSGNVLYGNGVFAAVVAPTSVANANYANYAGNVTTSAQPNITSLGTLTGLTVAGDATVTGNLAVDGNLTYVNVTNLVVQDPVIEMGGGPNGAPLTTNDGRDRGSLLHYYTTQPVDAFMGWDNSNGEFGFGSNVTNSNDVMTFNSYGNVRASTFIGNLTGTASHATVSDSANSVAGANVTGQVSYAAVANSVAGANVSGDVSGANHANVADVANTVSGSNVSGAVNLANYATVANSVAGANVSGQVAYAAVANSVAVANVSGIGNIAVLNLDGNVSNILHGNGFWGPESESGNANYANFAGTAFSVSGSNVVGEVANAAYATNSGHATVADSANSVAGANVTGAVAYATTANSVAGANVSGQVSYAAVANSVAGANVSGDVSGANHANIADVANSISGSNVSGAVNLANYATVANSVAGANVSGEVAYAAVANSVAVANVSGIGNIATINLDGNVSNLLAGNGTWIPVPNTASANFANYAGNVTVASQPNITSVGTLTTLAVSGNLSSGNANLGNLAIANYFSGDGGLLSNIAAANVVGNLPVRFEVKNTSGVTLTRGTPVHTTGTVGATTVLEVAASRADTISAMPCIGILEQDLNNNDFGYALSVGTLTGIDTSTYTVSDQLYVGATGGFTNVRPTGANAVQPIGDVGRVNSSTGSIEVNIWNYYQLPNLDDGNIWVGTTGNGTPVQIVLATANVGNANHANVADLANSVAVANVAGIGNIATINLDGSSSNVLYGNGVFAPESTTGNANYAAYAGNVTISAQPNITSVGNLTSLTIADSNVSNPTTQFIPTSNVIGTSTFSNSMIRIDQYNDLGNSNGVQTVAFVKSRGTSTSPTAASNSDVVMRTAGYIYNGNTHPKVAQILMSAPQAANTSLKLANTAWTAGIVQIQVGNPYGNTGNASANSNQNQITYNQNGTLSILAGHSPNGVTSSSILTTTYGIAANGVGLTQGWQSQRARGDRDGNLAVANGDSIGAFGFIGYNGNAFYSTRFAQILANVNTAHGTIANGASIPTDFNFITCSNTTAYTTTMYGNGSASFPGLITTTGNVSAGNISVTSSGNIANLQLNRFQETVYSIGTTSGTVTPDFNNGSIQSMTLNGSLTLNNLTNPVAGRSMTLIITQDGTGGHTMSSTFLFAGAEKTLSTAAGAIDIISVFYDGTTYYAVLSKGYA